MPSAMIRMPPSERPRERLVDLGAPALSDAELVSLVFGAALGAAHEVVARVGGAPGLLRVGLAELQAVPGVGSARACQLLAAVELGRRAARGEIDRGGPVRTPTDARARLADLALLEQEELHVLALDTRHRVIARTCVARGALNVVHVAPREVLRPLVRAGAAAGIVAHNHPSGDALPSEEDVELTARLKAAGELVGVPVLDHLIIAAGGYYTFSEGRLRSSAAGAA